MDRLTPVRRSWLMSRVKSRDTSPEMTVRKRLHGLGYRYRLHSRELPGKPDLVFPSRRKVVFVNGCYWHGHSCKYGKAQPKTNRAFWQEKLRRNIERDRRVRRLLRAAGWRSLVIWECQIKRDAWEARTVRFLDD
jgi:DNA mismatch endonuclease (patch repair protein)